MDPFFPLFMNTNVLDNIEESVDVSRQPHTSNPSSSIRLLLVDRTLKPKLNKQLLPPTPKFGGT